MVSHVDKSLMGCPSENARLMLKTERFLVIGKVI